jgi:mannosyltransferase
MMEFVARHALALIITLGAVLRFATLGVQDLWLDEDVTVNVISQGPFDLLKTVELTESNPALYYVLAGGWERLFGSGDVAVRSLSALLGTAAIPAIYGAANAIGSRRAGLIAAALAATSPLLIWYSQEARNYALLIFLAALSFFLFVRALDERGQRWLWGWGLASALALNTHYFAFLAIVPEVVWLLVSRRGRRLDTALAMGVLVVVGIALLPLAATQRGRGSWIADYSLSGRLQQIPEHFLVGLQVPWPILPALAIALVAAVTAYAVARSEARVRRALGICVSVAVAGLAIVLLAGAVGDDYIVTRNLLALWIPFAVALAIALASAASGRLGVAAAVVLCAAGLGLAIWNVTTTATHKPRYSELAEQLGPAPQNRLIVSQSSFSSPLTRYLDGTRYATDTDLAAAELVVLEQRPQTDYGVGDCWWMHTCGGIDLEPPERFEVPDEFELGEHGTTEMFEYWIYEAANPVAITRPQEYFTPRVFVQSPP